MNKKAITLPQFVKTFPNGNCFVKEQFVRPSGVSFDFNNDLPYSKKIKYEGQIYKFTQRLNANENCIYYVKETKRIRRSGKVFYPFTVSKDSIYINSHEISLNCSVDTVFEFLNHIGIDWFKDISSKCSMVTEIFKNKTIFRRIITNRIYNEETLYKSVASCMYKVKNISWRHIRKYCSLGYSRISLIDLVTFTKNPETSIDILYNDSSTFSLNITKYMDLINCAIKLNEVVDFNWSNKRIEAEHQRQIKILTSNELVEKKSVPIYDCTIKLPDNIKLLNTEKDIFYEGSFMHHCLYNCYYDKIKSHNYIAFHLTEPEECTLGIFIVNGCPSLNQIYKKYDQEVLDSTKEYAKLFISTHSKELIEMFNQKVKDDKFLEPKTQDQDFHLWQDELLPW